MAGRPSLNARSLEALGAAQLAELLLQHTEGNAAARRALRLALAETRGPQEMALEFLHRWPDQRRAARLILADPDRLNGADEPLLTAVAAVLEARQPLAASLCLRAMIEEVLDTARSSRYLRAVRHLESCRRLAASINEWGRMPPHNAYVRELLRAYGHRMGFLKKLDFDGLLLPE